MATPLINITHTLHIIHPNGDIILLVYLFLCGCGIKKHRLFKYLHNIFVPVKNTTGCQFDIVPLTLC